MRPVVWTGLVNRFGVSGLVNRSGEPVWWGRFGVPVWCACHSSRSLYYLTKPLYQTGTNFRRCSIYIKPAPKPGTHQTGLSKPAYKTALIKSVATTCSILSCASFYFHRHKNVVSQAHLMIVKLQQRISQIVEFGSIVI